MKTSRRLLAWLLTLVMIVGIIPVTGIAAYAAEEVTDSTLDPAEDAPAEDATPVEDAAPEEDAAPAEEAAPAEDAVPAEDAPVEDAPAEDGEAEVPEPAAPAEEPVASEEPDAEELEAVPSEESTLEVVLDTVDAAEKTLESALILDKSLDVVETNGTEGTRGTTANQISRTCVSGTAGYVGAIWKLTFPVENSWTINDYPGSTSNPPAALYASYSGGVLGSEYYGDYTTTVYLKMLEPTPWVEVAAFDEDGEKTVFRFTDVLASNGQHAPWGIIVPDATTELKLEAGSSKTFTYDILPYNSIINNLESGIITQVYSMYDHMPEGAVTEEGFIPTVTFYNNKTFSVDASKCIPGYYVCYVYSKYSGTLEATQDGKPEDYTTYRFAILVTDSTDAPFQVYIRQNRAYVKSGDKVTFRVDARGYEDDVIWFAKYYEADVNNYVYGSGPSFEWKVTGTNPRVYAVCNGESDVVDVYYKNAAELIYYVDVELYEPEAGQHPDYDPALPIGVQYVTGDYGDSVYKNDVCWRDLTNNGFALDPDTGVFIAGHTYSVDVNLVAKDGRYFAANATATLNQKNAVVSDIYQWEGQEEICITYTFEPLPAAVEITQQPTAKTVAAGTSVSFKVVATGATSYQWQYSNNGTTWTNCSSAGSNTATFSFTASTGFNNRQYRCIVSDGNTSITSTAAKLTVVGITQQPTAKTVAAGATVSFKVVATGATSYQWQYSKDGTTWTNCSSAGSNTATFSFVASTVFNGRQYRCQVKNGSVTLTSSAAKLIVK